MESDDELRERLRTAERAAAAPYVDFPPTPWWFPPFFGCYAAAVVACLVISRTDAPVLAQIAVIGVVLVMVAALGMWVGWDRSRRGTWPRFWGGLFGRGPTPPRELTRAMWGWVIGFVVVAVGVAVLAFTTPWWVAPLVAFVLVTAGQAWYEVVFARAAARARERLG